MERQDGRGYDGASSAFRAKDERPTLSEHSLAPYGNRVIRTPEDPRRAAIKRTLSWTLVVLVHLLFFGMFTINFLQNHERVGQRNAIETFFDLSLLRNPNAPEISMIKPEVVAPAPPEIS